MFWAFDNNLSRYLAQKLDVAKIVQLKSAIGGVLLFVIAVFVFDVKVNIDAHGGTISVKSPPTVFTITLPQNPNIKK